MCENYSLMNAFTKTKRRAISTVLTTIIILVASVVLASGVVLYGTSLFQSGTQQEAISVSGLKVWIHGTAPDGLAWGAFAVRNSGDKIVSVDKIAIRGQDIPFAQWYPDTTVTSSLIQQPMNFTGWAGSAGLINKYDPNDYCGASTCVVESQLIDQTDGSVCANAASGPVGLEPGAAAVIYFKLNNGTLQTVDSGISTSVNIFAGKTGAPLSITISSKLV